MKKVIPVAALAVVLFACSDSKNRYLDLTTGKAVEVKKDDKTGYMVNKETGAPLYIYVDTKKNDTIYAKTGEVINGHVVVNDRSEYIYDKDEKLEVNDGNMKYKDGDYKVEVEKDGDIKIKNGDSKVKIDGETNERKVKNDD